MSTKRATNQMTVEDLLKELDVAKDDTVVAPELLDETAYKNDVMAFISKFNILPGENRVRKSVMYSLYRTWSENPIPAASFVLQFSSLISSEIKSTKHYHINQSAVKITYDAFKLRNKKISKVKSKTWGVKFQLFVDHYELEKATGWIHEALLIELHERYMFLKTGRVEMTPTHTVSFLKVFFKHKLTKHGILYLVNEKVMDKFTKREVTKIMKNYEKKEVKKKQAKTS